TEFSQTDETWTQPWGENKTVRNAYNQMTVHLMDEAQTELDLYFRLFDDGVGFRYEYRVPKADSLLITDELTTFSLAADGQSWSIPANYET
ncbi:glycoside hydrolase family 97 N-terminal domain-containing protein, partial [Acinetobacter baumannii]|nr:glycoside hydrolase family 97 N-terminal domain-containing protein [Acinetobacter baumannii]